MSRILINTKDLSREDWLKYRTLGIGGSDAGAICGLNPYSSPIDVFLEKLGEKEPPEENEAMRQGRDFEDYVAKRFEEATGKKVRRRNVMLQHDEHDFILANIDREVVGEDAILECKTASVYATDKWRNGVPEHYELQCHHYMAVTGAKKCYLACLILNKELVIRELERDEELIASLISIEKEFWENHVVKKEMPAPDGSEAATDAIKILYADTNAEAAIDLAGYEHKLKRFAEIGELKTQLEQEEEKIKQEIMLEMKESEVAFAGERKITWKRQNGRKTIDSKNLQKDHPDIYNIYLKEGKPFRVFKIS